MNANTRTKVVMQKELGMGATDRIRDVADVVIDDAFAEVAGAEVIVMGGANADAALMDKAGASLKLIATPGIGVDKIDIDAASERGISVIHTPDAPTESTAEHTIGLLLGVATRVVAGDRFMHNNELGIERADMVGTEVYGQNLGVVGYGRIGKRVAEICALGLRMNVKVYDPYVNQRQITPQGITLTEDFADLLSTSQFVTLHVPLLPATHKFFGERELRLMPKGSYFINAARGSVVDEQALIRVLQAGHLAGAALDVSDPEPPEPDNPLLTMKNVITTPHIASGTEAGIHAMMHGVADQIIQLVNGERPRSLVNPEVWPGRAA